MNLYFSAMNCFQLDGEMESVYSSGHSHTSHYNTRERTGSWNNYGNGRGHAEWRDRDEQTQQRRGNGRGRGGQKKEWVRYLIHFINRYY